MKPTIAPRPADPIDIDPGVPFKWVIAAQNATSVGYIPNENFTVDQDGKTLDITCTATLTDAEQTFTLSVFASNKDGTVYQHLKFRVRAAEHLIQPWFPVETLPAGSDVYFNAISPGSPIGDNLSVDWKVKFSRGAYFNPAPVGANFPQNIFFVKSIDAGGKKFKVAIASGGAAVTEDGGTAYGIYFMAIATCLNGSDKIYVRDSSQFAVNDPINLQYSDGSLLPPELRGPLYVKTIVDDCYIKVSAAVGGAAIVATADSFATPPNPLNANSFPPAKADDGVNLISDNTTRKIPSIDSDEETDVDLLAAVAYTITTDVAADEFEAQGLPKGLELNDETGEITGNPSEAGFFPIVLLAYKGDAVAYRYWILVVGGADGLAIAPDLIYDIGSRGFYSLGGPAGRANRIDVVFGNPPLLFGIQQNGDDFSLPEGATVRVRAKQALSDAADLVYATKTLDAAASQTQLDEDWSSGLLLALLADKKFVDLIFWFELRLDSDPVGLYRSSYPTVLRLFPNDSAGFGGSSPAFFVQTKPYTALTGGAAGSLDGVATAGLAVDTWIAVVVINDAGVRTKSEWELVAGNEAEDVDAGIVRPDDYNAGTNQKVWVRL